MPSTNASAAVLREPGRPTHAALAEAVGLGICAFVAIAPRPRKPAGRLVAGLLSMPEIVELHAVAGTYA